MANLNLIQVNQNQKDDYNRFVATSRTGSFLQSYDWGDWQTTLGRQVFRFWIENSPGNIIGAVQLIKMSLPLGKFYLYAPYGPVEADNYELRIKNYEWLTGTLKEKFPEVIFVRIEPKNLELATSHSQLATKTANIQPGKTLVIDLLESEDQLLAQMHHKTRYNIRLAQKHGVEIKDEFDISIGHGLFAQEAADLIVQTATRQGYRGYGRDYYKQLVDFFAVHNRVDLRLHIYKAIYQNKLLASAIMVDFPAKGGGVRTFLFGGSSEECKNVMAPYLMHWQAIQDAKKGGLEVYDFWGAETSTGKQAGFVRFKMGFAHSTSSGSLSGIKEYAGAYDLVLNPLWYKIYRLSRKLLKLIK